MESTRQPEDSLTASQRDAVKARGNVLVMAGAGTGKTKTLVERCLDCLARDGAAINELLIVTFTEAAAAEMRQRLRRELEKKTAAEPDDEHWQRQLALFELAPIGTLHSFCLRLVREHFYELGLDPQLALLDEGEARQRADETLDAQFQAHYAGENEFSLAVQTLVQTHGGGRDETIRELILRLHHYSQTRPDAAAWLAAQRKIFSAAEPVVWHGWLLEEIENWRAEWGPVLETLKADNVKAAELAGIFARWPKKRARAEAADFLAQIVSADGNWPARQKILLRQPLEQVFSDATFLHSLAAVQDNRDPLAEDWSWVRPHLATLLRLAQEFAEHFSARKREDGVMDFHDLEQFALQLLWDFCADRPTPTAAAWRTKLKFIFVDEYQDINAAQDKIIQALSGENNLANRFLVGDVKQSIYRFRLADPKIFRGYAQTWRGGNGKTVALSENFRSREGLLNFVNSLCGLVMREEIGGVKYDLAGALKFGSPAKRGKLSVANQAVPCVELWLQLKAGRHEVRDEAGEWGEPDEAQKEARLVAVRLQQLFTNKTLIWDDAEETFRAVEWRDMAILLRSPRGKAEIFAREFERARIPLAVPRGRFYDSAEIRDLLSLLQLLDNPLQDVPCIAVLRSPLVGLSLDELAAIRLGAKEHYFWTAVTRFQNLKPEPPSSLSGKLAKFLDQFLRWRQLARQVSLSECLEAILAETLYLDWLRAQPHGAQRAANVASLRQLAQKFDQFQRQGLFRFLKFIGQQQAAATEPEVSAVAAENAVRLLSIHQSKGLEFPIVVLADLAKTFNEQDLRGEIIFDEQFGLCPKVKPPSSGRRYPSLTHWLAQHRQKRELRGEELRLLYVALTRARDHLILTASISEKNWAEKWTQSQTITSQKIAGARSFADWLALWFSDQLHKSKAPGTHAGELEHLTWHRVSEAELSADFGKLPGYLTLPPAAETGRKSPPNQALDEIGLEKLRERLAWNYPFRAASQRKAKSSVTALRREAEELDAEAAPVFRPEIFPESSRKMFAGKLSAAETGAAHHKFLQHVALEKTGQLAAEAERLTRENYLSAAERAVLDLDALGYFWNSNLGQKIVSHAVNARRELPFTARFRPAEIAEIIGGKNAVGLETEFIVVQGVADLAVILPAEIWLVDFKTDALGGGELPEKIKTYTPQLRLYAAALAKIFGRNVTRRALHFLAAGRTEEI